MTSLHRHTRFSAVRLGYGPVPAAPRRRHGSGDGWYVEYSARLGMWEMKATKRYVITITPLVGDSTVGQDDSRTTMLVDVEDTQVHIRELTVRVGDNARLTSGDLLNVDFDLLTQAFVGRHPALPGPVAASGAAAEAAVPAGGGYPVRSERAYRRMPDPDDLRATYLKSRTITGVAAHYGVPTHTAQGWVTRLRRKGVIPANK